MYVQWICYGSYLINLFELSGFCIDQLLYKQIFIVKNKENTIKLFFFIYMFLWYTVLMTLKSFFQMC